MDVIIEKGGNLKEKNYDLLLNVVNPFKDDKIIYRN